jgi:hypothetical protein
MRVEDVLKRVGCLLNTRMNVPSYVYLFTALSSEEFCRPGLSLHGAE